MQKNTTGTWRRLCREPLLHFTLPAVAIFLLYSWWAPTDRQMIALSPETLESLIGQREVLLGRPLTNEERTAAVEDFVDGEILVREARRLGLDQRDARIRHRLIDKMRFLLDEAPAEPTPEALESYYQGNLHRYLEAKSVSFDHVFLTDDRVPPAVLVELQGGADFSRLGEPFWLGSSLVRFSQEELAKMMGEGFARDVFELEAGVWSDPLTSSRGQHLVRVNTVHPSHLPQLSTIVATVAEDWQRDRRLAVQTRKLEALRRLYPVGGLGFDPSEASASGETAEVVQASLVP